MPTSTEPWQPIVDTLAQLRAAWPSRDWTWDPRFKCVTSSVPADAADAARGILATTVPSEWSDTTFATAPAEVRALSERCGEVRPGQALMTASPVAGMILFAMWWPWGDGSKVSIRLGVANSDRPKDLYPLVRSLFGIA